MFHHDTYWGWLFNRMAMILPQCLKQCKRTDSTPTSIAFTLMFPLRLCGHSTKKPKCETHGLEEPSEKGLAINYLCFFWCREGWITSVNSTNTAPLLGEVQPHTPYLISPVQRQLFCIKSISWTPRSCSLWSAHPTFNGSQRLPHCLNPSTNSSNNEQIPLTHPREPLIHSKRAAQSWFLCECIHPWHQQSKPDSGLRHGRELFLCTAEWKGRRKLSDRRDKKTSWFCMNLRHLRCLQTQYGCAVHCPNGMDERTSCMNEHTWRSRWSRKKLER